MFFHSSSLLWFRQCCWDNLIYICEHLKRTTSINFFFKRAVCILSRSPPKWTEWSIRITSLIFVDYDASYIVSSSRGKPPPDLVYANNPPRYASPGKSVSNSIPNLASSETKRKLFKDAAAKEIGYYIVRYVSSHTRTFSTRMGGNRRMATSTS